MSLGTLLKRVIAEDDSIIKGKSTALLSFQWKLNVARSLVLSAPTDVTKPEGTEHRMVKSYLLLMDYNKSFNIIRNVLNNTPFHVYLEH